jgi:hypothetical protein
MTSSGCGRQGPVTFWPAPMLIRTVADHTMRGGPRRDAGVTNISLRAQNTV